MSDVAVDVARAGGAGAATTLSYDAAARLAEVGLYHFNARAYSATLGRFLQSDPILHAGGMNLYAYVGDDPVNRIDPLGLGDQDEEWDGSILVTGMPPRPTHSPLEGVRLGGFGGLGEGRLERPPAELEQVVVTARRPPRPPPVAAITTYVGAQQELCRNADQKVSRTQSNLGSGYTDGWRWNSLDALEYDLVVATLNADIATQISDTLGAFSTGSGLASLPRSAPWPRGAGVASTASLGVGTLAHLDAIRQQGYVDALSARLSQLQYRAAGWCSS